METVRLRRVILIREEYWLVYGRRVGYRERELAQRPGWGRGVRVWV